MIGKSYDGTLANGVAATGSKASRRSSRSPRSPLGTTTSRIGGVRLNTNYPQSLNNNVTTPAAPSLVVGVTTPGRRTLCAPINTATS